MNYKCIQPNWARGAFTYTSLRDQSLYYNHRAVPRKENTNSVLYSSSHLAGEWGILSATCLLSWQTRCNPGQRAQIVTVTLIVPLYICNRRLTFSLTAFVTLTLFISNGRLVTSYSRKQLNNTSPRPEFRLCDTSSRTYLFSTSEQ